MATGDFVNTIKEAGITGAGGAGFPTWFKYSSQCEILILNGAECEPLLQVDQQMLKVHAAEIIEAFKAAMQASGALKGYIALKKKYKEAISALTPLCTGNIELFTMDNFYPAGDEQIMVNEITGRVVPEGGIPIQVGVIVNNAVTFYNIYNALHGKPVTHRQLTVAGEVKTPVTISVPIGVSVEECIRIAGGITCENPVIVDGGPMMAKIIPLSARVGKTTSGILVFPENHTVIRQKNDDISRELWISKALCCQCMMCTEVCPRYLIGHRMEPHKIMRGISYGDQSDYKNLEAAFLCCECNACTAFGCPMGLSPRNVNRIVKRELASRKIKNPFNARPKNAKDVRQMRKIPVPRLVSRLDIEKYMKAAPFAKVDETVFTKVEIALNQHIGLPAQALVQAGQNVETGQVIARSPEGLGSVYHASVSGKVVRAENDCIVIEKN